MLSSFPYSIYQSRSMFLPPWQHAKYKGQTNKYGIQSLKLDFYVYKLHISNQIGTNFHCTKINFHCTKMIKYENNIVPTPCSCLKKADSYWLWLLVQEGRG